MFIGLEITGVTKESQGFIIKEAVERSLLSLLPNGDEVLCIDVEIASEYEIGDACWLVDEHDQLEYTIYLNKNILDDDIELFKTVCHECIHIKQYFNEELVHLNNYRVLFNNKTYDTFTCKYEDRPWEQEAHQTEQRLFQENREFLTSLTKK